MGQFGQLTSLADLPSDAPHAAARKGRDGIAGIGRKATGSATESGNFAKDAGGFLQPRSAKHCGRRAQWKEFSPSHKREYCTDTRSETGRDAGPPACSGGAAGGPGEGAELEV